MKTRLELLVLARDNDREQINVMFQDDKLTAEEYIEVTEIIDKGDSQQIAAEISQLQTESPVTGGKSKNKRGKKKFIIIPIVLLVLFFFGLGLYVIVSKNMYHKVDLADYMVVDIIQDGDDLKPRLELSGTWEYYNEAGYYDDMVKELVNSGQYTEEEAIALEPTKPIALDVEQIYSSYKVDRDVSEVTNGDMIEITVDYDQDLADQLKIKVINNKIDFQVDGLEQVISDEQAKSVVDQIDYSHDQALVDMKAFVGTEESYEIKPVTSAMFISHPGDNPVGSTPQAIGLAYTDSVRYTGMNFDAYNSQSVSAIKVCSVSNTNKETKILTDECKTYKSMYAIGDVQAYYSSKVRITDTKNM